MIRIQISGIPQLSEKLRTKTEEVKKLLFKNVEQGSINIQDGAKGVVPVRTGRLKRSIINKVTQSGMKTEGVIHPNTEYESYVEFGTSRMRARPYMTPSFEENWRRIVGKIEDDLRSL